MFHIIAHIGLKNYYQNIKKNTNGNGKIKLNTKRVVLRFNSRYLEFILDHPKYDQTNTCMCFLYLSSDQIVLHDPEEEPDVNNKGFILSPGMSTYVSMKMTQVYIQQKKVNGTRANYTPRNEVAKGIMFLTGPSFIKFLSPFPKKLLIPWF